MESDPTEESIRKEIADAVRIAREDGMHIHKTYARFQKSLEGKPPTPPTPPTGDPKDPPPLKDTPPPTPTKKKGIWWGDRDDD
jgi:hypothetical protein